MKSYIRLIDDQTNGKRCDVTPIFADPAAFCELMDDLTAKVGDLSIDLVAGIDALGFILGAGLALRLHRGFIPIRKGGKLPSKVITEEFVDYSGERKALELRCEMIQAGQRVLIVDEWIETGAQVNTAIRLIKRAGGSIAGIATINMDANLNTEPLTTQYSCFPLLIDMKPCQFIEH